MRHEIVGGTGNAPEVAFLCPRIQVGEIAKHYYKPHLTALYKDVMVCDPFIDKTKKKTSNAHIKEYLNELIPVLLDRGITLLVVTQPDYFKVLTKKSKTDATIGDVIETIVPGLFAAYCPNYSRVFYDPDKIKAKIHLALESVQRFMTGNDVKIGSDIIKFVEYPKTDAEIIHWLARLLEMDCDLTCDTENFSLKHYNSGVGTVTFCWNEHEGVAFPVDYQATTPTEDAPKTVGKQVTNPVVRDALKQFFKDFNRKMIYHNICYDVYVLVYQLFMWDILDQTGMLEGLDVMLRDWDCSQLITYLATNSCAGNELGLKIQSQSFAGNYGQEDIHDITLIPLEKLLEYNMIDGLATWFVYKKNQPIMIADQQEDVYLKIFKPAAKDIIQMQLTGLPINKKKVVALEKKLQAESDILIGGMNKLNTVKSFLYTLGDEMVVAKNLKMKKKVITRADLGLTKDTVIEFNPQSPLQLQRLLYDEDFLGLPVLDRTDTKMPATGADTLEKLINHTTDPEVLDLLNLLIKYKASAIILSTFLPAFLQAQWCCDPGSGDSTGWHYLFGNFRLGGTASGRLSSANPNLQNIPSNGATKIKARLAKMIKECIEAPSGWLFVGLDFDSLEDKISAVTTKDPMKIKVYSDGYDGHCLRAFKYFRDEMPDIVDTVASINSIKKVYPDQRQRSKVPTFALTYDGTFITLMKNVGLSKEAAKSIEKHYHEMYVVSDEWVKEKIRQASKDGYVTIAFGLRLRTPLLNQVVLGTRYTPHEAASEGRTAGNALGQSWCMLNSRALSEFMAIVRKGEYRLDIKPCASIHDANYLLIRDNVGVLLYTNVHLSKAVSWQEDPLIQNEHISMSGELDVYFPNWNHGMTIPNDATVADITRLTREHLEGLK